MSDELRAEPPPSVPPAWLVVTVAASPATLLLLILWAPADWMPHTLGRLHPVVLHFPIALLLLTAILELVQIASRGRRAFPSRLILFFGAMGAVGAVACGVLLMRGEAAAGDLVNRHMFGGITVAVLALVTLALRCARGHDTRKGVRYSYRAALAASCIALAVTGHDGASLTHGEGYLTEHLPWSALPPAKAVRISFPRSAPENWEMFDHVVAPILEVRCASCHNPRNSKGKLVLSDWASIERGGATGPLLVSGAPARSLLLERLRLPLEHKEHMPPKQKPQPTAGEIRLLERWIQAGAPREGTLAALHADQVWLADVVALPEILGAAASAPAPEEFEIDPAEVARLRASVAETIAALQQRFPGMLNYESRTSADVHVNASVLGAAFGDAELAQLAPIASHIVVLDLSGTAITDRSAAMLPAMKRLRTLRLGATRIGDPTIRALAAIGTLESLSLFQTSVSEKSLVTLAKLPALKRVYLAGTGIEDEAVSASRLRAAAHLE